MCYEIRRGIILKYIFFASLIFFNVSALAESKKLNVNSEVTLVFENYASAIQQKNVSDALGAYYNQLKDSPRKLDPHFFWIEDGKISYSSLRDIQLVLEGLFKYKSVQIEFSNFSFFPLSKKFLQVRVSSTVSVQDSVMGSFSFSTLTTYVMVKTQNGWKFLNGHSSTLK
jgi:hypothetical protein